MALVETLQLEETAPPALALPELELVPPAVEIVVPVRNEERILESSVRRLHAFLTSSFPFSFRVTIADNGSTDGTWRIASKLEHELPHVRAARLELAGRGHALHSVWSKSTASVLVYMDADLSTDLKALLPLVAPLLSGHSDLAIGSRLARGARVVRGPKRELISRAYNTLLSTTLRARFSDAQCGFKAIRADRAQELLPLVQDDSWFFDTELLVLAERMGLRIHEVPVDWIDDPDSRVDIVSTAIGDLRGVVRLAYGLARGRIPVTRAFASSEKQPTFGVQAFRFAVIGIVSTIAYLVLYLGLRSALPAQSANALALLTTAIANTAANRRLTFAIRGREGVVRHQVQGLVAFVIALALTATSLAALHLVDPYPSHAVELAVLVPASVLATAFRFALLRIWVFRSRRSAPLAEEGS